MHRGSFQRRKEGDRTKVGNTEGENESTRSWPKRKG